MSVWQLAGSAIAVCLLVLLAWKFGYSGQPDPLDEAEARALAAEVTGGFEAEVVGLDRSGHAALLRDAAGGIVLVAPVGAHFVAQSIGPAADVSCLGGLLTLREGKIAATLDLGSGAEDWALALSRLK